MTNRYSHVGFVALVGCVIGISGCTQPEKAKRLLAEQGYTNVRITGYDWFACSQDDTSQTGFRATAPSGKEVEGVVCSGLLFKGATIRFN